MSLESLPKIRNPMLSTLAADSTEIMLRGDHAGVPQTAMLRFYSMFPDGALEIARVVITAEHVRALIDLFARSINYFPVKPEDPPASNP